MCLYKKVKQLWEVLFLEIKSNENSNMHVPILTLCKSTLPLRGLYLYTSERHIHFFHHDGTSILKKLGLITCHSRQDEILNQIFPLFLFVIYIRVLCTFTISLENDIYTAETILPLIKLLSA